MPFTNAYSLPHLLVDSFLSQARVVSRDETCCLRGIQHAVRIRISSMPSQAHLTPQQKHPWGSSLILPENVGDNGL